MAEVVRLEQRSGVTMNIPDQCMYGLKTPSGDKTGEMPARKRTPFMTDSFWVAIKRKQLGSSHPH